MGTSQKTVSQAFFALLLTIPAIASNEDAWYNPCPTWQKNLTITDEKKITVIIPSYNNAQWYNKNLDSVFAQKYNNYHVIYIDDCSPDGTGDLVQAYLEIHQVQEKISFIRNKTRHGALANIYKAIHMCNDEDIIITVDGDDWLANNSVFSIINERYHDPNVWITYGHFSANNFFVGRCGTYPDSVVKNNEYRNYHWYASHLRTFYAGLFKKIKLEDFLHESDFYPMAWDVAFMLPMLEMAHGKFKFMPHILYIYNVQNPINDHKKDRGLQIKLDVEIRKKEKHIPLQHLNNEKQSGASMLIFSYNRPLQLYALLESTQKHISGLEKIYVLYRTGNQQFENGYQEVKNSFSGVEFIKQGNKPHHNFKNHVLQVFSQSPGDYILFAVDDIVIKDTIEINSCIDLMNQTKAYGFFFRLGKNITECYMLNKKHELPKHTHVKDNVYAWQFKNGQYDWNYPHNVDMTLYNKNDIKNALYFLSYVNPNTLEGNWTGDRNFANKKNEDAIGLFFEQSKIVNIPLNLVNQGGNRNMNLFSPEQLLEKFNQGKKIDIKAVSKVKNKAPHMAYEPRFIERS